MDRIPAAFLPLLASAAVAQPFTGPMPQLGIEDPPTPIGAAAHRLTRGSDSLILSYLQGGTTAIELRYLRLTEAGWGEPAVVAQNPKMLANSADVPAVVEGGDGAMYAHWLLAINDKASAYDIHLNRSTDGGQTWADLGVLNDDAGKVAQHGFVTAVPDAAGIRAYWLDGRETVEQPNGFVTGPMTLRTALVGATVNPSELLDGQVCDCCTTGAAVTDAGPIVVYRDRTDDEVRDTGVVGGATGGPTILHEDGWIIPGCPVNGPAVAASGARVVVVWFTAAGNLVRVCAKFSDDNGATWGPMIVVDEARGQDVPIGRVDVLLDGDEAIVSWLATRRKQGQIMLQRVGPGGLIGAPLPLAPMDQGRLSGSPEMERLGDRVIVVWRDPDAKQLRAAALGLEYIGKAAP
jgi:hypothetical protein